MKALPAIGVLLFFLLLVGCGNRKTETVVLAEEQLPLDVSSIGKEKLSEYGFFKGPLKDLSPVDDVIPYALNSALFSDYAFKKRFIKIPAAQKASYSPDEVFDFPEGTVLIKNFYYPADFRKPDDAIRILETRLLIKKSGLWETLPYVWNDAQTDAFLTVGGKNIEIAWTHFDGTHKEINYSVPNLNQCKGCHLKNDAVVPVGPTARQLNRDYVYSHGKQNQLTFWNESEKLEGMPAMNEISRLANYEDERESTNGRARAWLEVNCAHCHRSDGPAKNSGLFLLASTSDPARLGVGKAPVAAGKGSGGRLYSIVPGDPDASILQFRIESTDPGIMMPEAGRKMVHAEGVKLIRQWISEMKVSK
ncbi:MAG TPA: SO2930 family diheme c-type cytochrome [Cyclobacteriaceae bacterium]|nr:SO2930 family diheme c-type cytochrome [Cyclobacteriaceae bacterium]